MTEAEWLDCAEPGPMLEFLRGRAGDRKLRLFACACCQSIWRFIPVGPCREAVEVSLRYADGHATTDELAAARAAAIVAADRAGPHSAAAWAACEAADPSAIRAARAAAHEAQEQVRRASRKAAEDEARTQAGFLRDIFGDLILPVRANVLRRLAGERVVREIAEELYDGGPQEDMRALAEELELRGCPSPEVLEHCRSAEPHVRGCWVIDLILRSPDTTPETAGKQEFAEAVSEPVSNEAGPSPIAPAEPFPVPPSRALPPRVQEIREALMRKLGPKKYRRFLRKAIGSAPSPGQVYRPLDWDEFIRTHPGYDIPDDQLIEVWAVCVVHGCELVPRVVVGPEEDPRLFGNHRFLSDRGSLFPYSYPEESVVWETERSLWWCPDCQRARAEWMQRWSSEQAPRSGL